MCNIPFGFSRSPKESAFRQSKGISPFGFTFTYLVMTRKPSPSCEDSSGFLGKYEGIVTSIINVDIEKWAIVGDERDVIFQAYALRCPTGSHYSRNVF